MYKCACMYKSTDMYIYIYTYVYACIHGSKPKVGVGLRMKRTRQTTVALDSACKLGVAKSKLEQLKSKV